MTAEESILKAKHQEKEQRLQAILALLERSQDRELVKLLSDVLQDESDLSEVRAAAALALGKVGSEQAVEALIDSRAAEEPTVRSYVIDALATTRNARALPTIIQALEDHSNQVFAMAAQGLGKMGRSISPHLIPLLDHPRSDVRCVAAWQLGEFREEGAMSKLVDVILENNDVEVTALSIWALGAIGKQSERVMDALSWAREQEEPEIRLRADMAMKKIVQYLN